MESAEFPLISLGYPLHRLQGQSWRCLVPPHSFDHPRAGPLEAEDLETSFCSVLYWKFMRTQRERSSLLSLSRAVKKMMITYHSECLKSKFTCVTEGGATSLSPTRGDVKHIPLFPLFSTPNIYSSRIPHRLNIDFSSFPTTVLSNYLSSSNANITPASVGSSFTSPKQ
jgi:hypothetical protein